MRRALERGDAVALALIGHVNVDLGGADVDVPRELADNFQRDVALGEHRAERVSERVCGAAVLAHAGAGGVLDDDIAAGTPIVLTVAIDKPALSGWKSVKAKAGARGVFVRHDHSFVQTRAGVDREVVMDVIEIDGRQCKLARQWFTVAA